MKLAIMHFEGKANIRFHFYQSSRTNIHWNFFINDVVTRFESSENRDAQDLFNNLRQVCSVTI